MHRRGIAVCILLFAASWALRSGAQSQYDAVRDNPFSRVMLGFTASSLGTGLTSATNLGPKVDLRVFGNYTNITHSFTRSAMRVGVNVGMANAGAKVDFYPLHRFPLRLSPGYLFFNQNRIAANLRAEQWGTFTLNNVDYLSDNADPIHGTGRLELGGSGLMLTAGIGHFLSHTYKRLTFPFEAGVVFIHTPTAQFNLLGKVCSETNTNFCQPAAQFPTFATNLAAQLKSWNQTVAPYHVYPVIEGGIAYSFTLRRWGIEEWR